MGEVIVRAWIRCLPRTTCNEEKGLGQDFIRFFDIPVDRLQINHTGASINSNFDPNCNIYSNTTTNTYGIFYLNTAPDGDAYAPTNSNCRINSKIADQLGTYG